MDNITSATIKLISSLGTAAHRRREKLFAAEGSKSVADTLGHFELVYLVATAAWFDEHPHEASRPEALKATARDLGRMSHLSTPPAVIAVYRLPEVDADAPIEADGMILALDSIQDPGNLGTILRTADWMGIHTVFASRETADCYGPKAIQATMGSISRVSVRYVDLPEALIRLKSQGREIYGTLLNGEDIYTAPGLTSRSVLIIGNEGRGISEPVKQTISRALTIPSGNPQSPHGESLNAAVAAALSMAALRFNLKHC